LMGAVENIGIVDFRRDLAFSNEFTLNFWPRVAGVALTITTAAVWHSYWALVAGLLFARGVRLPLTYWMSSYRPRFSLRAWRRLLGFSLWTWAQTILYQARERSDSFVVGRLLGSAQVGVFSVGCELGSLPITELAEPLNRALFSGFASLQHTADGLGNMFRGAVGLGFLLLLPAGFGISMVADPMVRIALGDQWIAAVPVVQIMAITGTTAIFTQSCGTLLNVTGRPHVTFYIGAVSTPLKVLLLLLLVPLGLRGAAVALWISSIADLTMFLWITLPRIQVSLRQLAASIIRPVIATAAMVLVLAALNMAWTTSTAGVGLTLWKDLCSRSLLGGLCYVTVLFATWLAAGQPAGAEYFALTVLRNGWARIRSRIQPDADRAS
jgi:lipopolysaccharide exporter